MEVGKSTEKLHGELGSQHELEYDISVQILNDEVLVGSVAEPENVELTRGKELGYDSTVDVVIRPEETRDGDNSVPGNVPIIVQSS